MTATTLDYSRLFGFVSTDDTRLATSRICEIKGIEGMIAIPKVSLVTKQPPIPIATPKTGAVKGVVLATSKSVVKG